MVIRSRNPWETTTKAELVSIGAQKLFLSTSGVPRRHRYPVVVFFTGGGAPIATHLRLQRLLSAFSRVYFWDPSGHDQSERSPVTPHTASASATEFTALLHTVQVAPPYILVGVSYGCIMAREFLHLHSAHEGAIAGMVLVEAATELLFELCPQIPSADLLAVAEGVDFVGLTAGRVETH